MVDHMFNIDEWVADTNSNFNNGSEVDSNVMIEVVNSGAETKCPSTNRWIKWKMPSSSGSQDSRVKNSSWDVTLKVVRRVQVSEVTHISSWIQFLEQDKLIQVPVQSRRSSQVQDMGVNLVEEYLIVHLAEVLDICKDETGTLIKLILCFGQLELTNYDVCQFEIKELHLDVKVRQDEYKNGETIGIREKIQRVTGPHKGRCQRFERKDLRFFLQTNISLRLHNVTVFGYVKRVNDAAMLGKEKAVTGEIKVPLSFVKNSMQDPQSSCYVYDITTDLDPDQFYLDHPGKELYTSDKNTPDNNVFIFGIILSVGDDQSIRKEVYQFKTKSKERATASNKHQFISAIELEAARADIKDLKVQRLITTRGDIAYSWHLLDAEGAARYEEGDVMGIFSSKIHDPNDKTYLDLLTPDNYKEAIIAGVITRSYYIAANQQEDEDLKPSENICMIGKIPIKVYGSVKHGDFIYASNRLPGVGVTEEQLIVDKGNWREKRLLGYSLESNSKVGIKLASCIVSILLSINNEQVEGLLGKLENTLSQNFERKIDEFRDDVDIKMDGMNQIMNTTQDYVATKRREVSRRTCRVYSIIMMFFVIGILSCYFFLSPSSPYIEWRCRQGSLPGTITFKIENNNDDKLIRMEGILFKMEKLRRKIDVEFGRKKNFTGSYYLNLRKCKRDNLRKVLGWFSNPPVYIRAQVFAATCDCNKTFHYHQQHSWMEYKPAFYIVCQGKKSSSCIES